MIRASAALTITLALTTPQMLSAQGLGVGDGGEYGRYLTFGDRPVYAFITGLRGGDDLPALESCLQRCRRDWPPVGIAELPNAQGGADPALIAATETDDLLVLTYNGYPLFYFAGEAEEPGPSGHAIHTYGGWWQIMSPAGEPIVTGIVPDAPE